MLARRASFASDTSDGMIDLPQMLSTLPFFAGASNSQVFSEEIASAMKIRYFKPGDQVIKFGDVAKCMYLVIRGELSIMSEDNEVEFATLVAGQFGMQKCFHLKLNIWSEKLKCNVISWRNWCPLQKRSNGHRCFQNKKYPSCFDF
jgi:CRP-like cAMP-binding protein